MAPKNLVDVVLHTKKGIAGAILGSFVLNQIKRYKIPIPSAETQPLAVALIVCYASSIGGVLPRKWHASITALCYAATASNGAAELLAVVASTRYIMRSVSDLRQREAAAIFMACQPFIIHHWSAHSQTLGSFFRSFLDRHIGFSRTQLERYRQDMSSERGWVSMEVTHENNRPFHVAYQLFLRSARKTGYSLGVVSLFQSLIGLPWAKGLSNVLAALPKSLWSAVTRWLWNTVFLVCVFQSSVLGPLAWNWVMGRRRVVPSCDATSSSDTSEVKFQVLAPSLALRSAWWWFVASSIFFEKAGRRKNVAAFMAAQSMVIAMKRLKVAELGLPLVAASALYFS